MSGGNYNQGGYPQQPGGYPPQGGYAPQQPYGQPGLPAQPGGPGHYVPPSYLPEQCFGGFWIRFAAVLLDGLIIGVPLGIVNGIIQVAMAGSMQMSSRSDGAPSAAAGGMALGLMMVLLVLYFVVPALYYILMESKKGGTVGKLALGLRTVDQNGMYMGAGQATGRFLGRWLSGCILYIGFIMAGFDPQKRALHDKMSGTFVVRKEFVNPAQYQVRA